MTTEWISYGHDESGVDKLFRVLNDRLYFALENTFNIHWNSFLECLEKLEDLLASKSTNFQEKVYSDDKFELYLRKAVNSTGTEPELDVYKKDNGHLIGWIKFTIDELSQIVSNVGY